MQARSLTAETPGLCLFRANLQAGTCSRQGTDRLDVFILELGEHVIGSGDVRPFFPCDHGIKVAQHAVSQFLCECALDLAAASCSNQIPTSSTTVVSVVTGVESYVGGNRAWTELRGSTAARLATASLKFPAI